MFSSIRNVYCVGRNYKAHAEELGNELPKEPMIFMKPSHALTPADGGAIVLPGLRGELHFETELVIRIGRTYEPGLTADELIDGMAFGIDFTLRDVQSGIKAKGLPWLPAKGFLRSAPLGPWMEFPGIAQLAQQDFTLRKNGVEAQRGNVSRMIFDLQRIIDFCAAHYGLGQGDIIFTGTPEGVAPVKDNDRMELFWGEAAAGAFTVSLQ
ncbi:MAG: fumarylacetoacetate hydrolase [Paenibacillaceae bacterium]|jgi:2-keto-4-pentenoate hydratase/2-oxohepta-3-ene-1,7-dioic acid hydratase in catechol pathway|nr:fumarylacetoacetate hydrolase [Paenibacillaceae bacterium]